jgi:hypothetical protein
MPNKEIIQVNLAAANPNLSPATRFGEFGFVARSNRPAPDQRRVGRVVREQPRYIVERIEMILETTET